MKRFAVAAFAGLTMAWSGAAFAEAQYGANLSFNQGLPALRTGTSLDGPHNINGDWSGASRNAMTYAHNQLGLDGAGNAIWSASHGGPGLHNAGGPPNQLGSIIARAAQLDNNAWGSASVDYTSMSASGTHNSAGGKISTLAEWSRGFSLEAGASFTFAALSTLSVFGDAAPLDAFTRAAFNVADSFASVVMGDSADRVRTSLTAAITGPFTGDLGSIFGFTFGPGGLMGITVTNTTGARLTGRLAAGTYVDVSAPIPEPGTTLLMLAGLGIVGLVARRRTSR